MKLATVSTLVSLALSVSPASAAGPAAGPDARDPGRAARFGALYTDAAPGAAGRERPGGAWLEKIPELAATGQPFDRRKALRSWVEYRNRTAATGLTDAQLAAAMPHLPPASRVALVALNLHRLAGDEAGQAALDPWVDRAVYPALLAGLEARGLVPASLGWVPDIEDLEDEFGFDAPDLHPLARSGLAGFLEGRFTARQLRFYMGMHNSKHAALAERIGARVLRVDPMLLGLETRCGFEADAIHVQAQIIFHKYVVGDVRRDTFRNWMRLAGDPELTACLLDQTDFADEGDGAEGRRF